MTRNDSLIVRVYLKRCKKKMFKKNYIAVWHSSSDTRMYNVITSVYFKHYSFRILCLGKPYFTCVLGGGRVLV